MRVGLSFLFWDFVVGKEREVLVEGSRKRGRCEVLEQEREGSQTRRRRREQNGHRIDSSGGEVIWSRGKAVIDRFKEDGTGSEGGGGREKEAKTERGKKKREMELNQAIMQSFCPVSTSFSSSSC